MTYSIVIQARMSSQRMPGKVCSPIMGRPMLSLMLERVRAVRAAQTVVVATSDDRSDDPVARLCRDEKVLCYRGSLEDVLDRYFQAARLAKSDAVIRLTGDCPLIDPGIVDGLVGIFEGGKYDYLANCAPPPGTFPDGMDVEIFSFPALEKAWREADKPSHREHVTFYFWQNPGQFRIFRHDLKEDLSGLRLTVDYPQDLEVVREIYSRLYPQNRLFNINDILSLLKEHPGIMAGNQGIKRNQGWESALRKDREAAKLRELS